MALFSFYSKSILGTVSGDTKLLGVQTRYVAALLRQKKNNEQNDIDTKPLVQMPILCFRGKTVAVLTIFDMAANNSGDIW